MENYTIRIFIIKCTDKHHGEFLAVVTRQKDDGDECTVEMSKATRISVEVPSVTFNKHFMANALIPRDILRILKYWADEPGALGCSIYEVYDRHVKFMNFTINSMGEIVTEGTGTAIERYIVDKNSSATHFTAIVQWVKGKHRIATTISSTYCIISVTDAKLAKMIQDKANFFSNVTLSKNGKVIITNSRCLWRDAANSISFRKFVGLETLENR